MFSLFSKRNQPKTNYSCDFGLHLLPDVSDGAKSLPESIAIIKMLYGMGIWHIITSASVNGNRLTLTPERITESLLRLRSAVEKEGIPVTLDAAGCYLLDEGFESLLAEKKFLTLPGNRLLIDNSLMVRGTPMHNLLFRIELAGYKPVLARVAQCPLYLRDMNRIKLLRQCDCDLQVDMLSLQGYYGRKIKLWSHNLVNNGYARYVGSGIRSEAQARIVAQYLRSASCRELLGKTSSILA